MRSTGAFTSKRSSILKAILHLRADNNTFSFSAALFVSLRSSALKRYFNAEAAEIRREPQRCAWTMLTLPRLPSYDRALPTVDTLSLNEKSIPM